MVAGYSVQLSRTNISATHVLLQGNLGPTVVQLIAKQERKVKHSLTSIS